MVHDSSRVSGRSVIRDEQPVCPLSVEGPIGNFGAITRPTYLVYRCEQ
jgi:hypothetical protein